MKNNHLNISETMTVKVQVICLVQNWEYIPTVSPEIVKCIKSYSYLPAGVIYEINFRILCKAETIISILHIMLLLFQCIAFGLTLLGDDKLIKDEHYVTLTI